MAERKLIAVNYDYDVEEHASWKAAAERKGQPLKEWIRRSLNQTAADETAAESERRRRSR